MSDAVKNLEIIVASLLIEVIELKEKIDKLERRQPKPGVEIGLMGTDNRFNITMSRQQKMAIDQQQVMGRAPRTVVFDEKTTEKTLFEKWKRRVGL